MQPDETACDPGTFFGHVLAAVDALVARVEGVEVAANGLPPIRDGRDGRDGAPGAEGAVGPAGNDGRDGADGRDGRDGLPGPEGRAGVDGRGIAEIVLDAGSLVIRTSDGVSHHLGSVIGPEGPAGVTGAAGSDGADGRDGRDGRDGVDGRDGDIGAQGPAGADGRGITDIALDAGVLTITTTDGVRQQLGSVIGPEGPVGPQGLPGRDGSAGVSGPEGRGIAGVATVDGVMVITYTDGAMVQLGKIIGPPGPPGDSPSVEAIAAAVRLSMAADIAAEVARATNAAAAQLTEVVIRQEARLADLLDKVTANALATSAAKLRAAQAEERAATMAAELLAAEADAP